MIVGPATIAATWWLTISSTNAFIPPVMPLKHQQHQRPSSPCWRIHDSSSSPEDGARETISKSSTGTSNRTDFALRNGKVSPASSDPFSDNLSIDPRSIDVVRRPPSETDMSEISFVRMFRGSANYIANHRATLAVYHIPGSLLNDPNKFRDLMNDVALTWLLGMKIVLVAGCRAQIDKRVPDRQSVNGMPVTDQDTLRVIKEEAGYVRFEVERQLARSLRVHGNMDGDGNVVSGNFFSAQPFGILDGVDYQFSGFVRRVEVEKIRQVHSTRGDICLLSTLGVSPSGEVFNVNSEALAASVAGALSASKVIFFTEEDLILRNIEFGNQVQSLRLSDTTNFLEHRGIEMHKRGVIRGAEDEADEKVRKMLVKIGWAKAALEQGVKRAHILAPTQGSLLQELYTCDGSGTLISRDIYEGIRRADVNDVVGIYELILPLIKAGTLVDRPKATLEKDVDNYYVYTRDDLVVACGQLKQYEEGFVEIGCLVVRREYRSGGKGDSMLGYLERLSLKLEATKVFVLSTQTMEWFIERGFEEVGVESLPASRQATYNKARASKIYMRMLDSDRELDASELWWNR